MTKADFCSTDSVHDVAIIGAGFSGICMGIKLLEAGIEDFFILERAAEVGGTWRDNEYPGCACDIPSHLYSFSFEPKADWSRLFPCQQEIQDYLIVLRTQRGTVSVVINMMITTSLLVMAGE